MRFLGPEEIAQRLATGQARAERIAQAPRQPASPQLEQALDRARVALALVISDVESTTSVREHAEILRYYDWVTDMAEDPRSWVLPGVDEEEGEDVADEDDELELACRFGCHTFRLDGNQSTAEIAADIAFQVQDDVTEEIWAAWPQCPRHEHPMSPAVEAETAAWWCPDDIDVSVQIGQLGAGVIPPSDSFPPSSPE
jgi:hypothetical protein